MKKTIILLVILAAGGYFAFQKLSVEKIPPGYDAVLFSSDQCPPCEKAALLMDINDVLYMEYNISESEENMALFKGYDGRQIPLIIFDHGRIDGYDKNELQLVINGLFEYENPTAVEMYSTSTCGWCDKTRQFFQNNHIEFTEYKIDQSASDNDRYKKLGGRGVPLIFIGNNRIDGYNEAGIRSALKQIDLM